MCSALHFPSGNGCCYFSLDALEATALLRAAPLPCSCSVAAHGSLGSVLPCGVLWGSGKLGPLSGYCSAGHPEEHVMANKAVESAFCLIALLIEAVEVYPCLQHFSWEAGRGIVIFALLVKYFAACGP